MGYTKKRYLLLYFAFIFFLCPLISQCTFRHQQPTKPPVRALPKYHTLKKGETLWRIAKKYNVPLEAIVRYNNIDDVTDIPVGKKIYIPKRRIYSRQSTPDFIWPLKGTITRGFKNTGPIYHTGIDILASEGTPILAAASGGVIYNGDQMAGYGNMLIIKHSNGFSTVYAHNRSNLVKVGENVKQGQIVAKVGSTGRSSGPHLHFEIRKDKKPVDPRLYLPNLSYE